MLLTVLGALCVALFLPFFIGVADIEMVHTLGTHLLHFISPPPVAESINGPYLVGTGSTSGKADVLKDAEEFVYDQKKLAFDQTVSCFYHTHVPQELVLRVDEWYTMLTEHWLYQLYKEHEQVVYPIVILIACTIALNLLLRLYEIFGQIKKEEVPEVIVIDEKYTGFETMPMCTGKALAEELLMLKSYEERHIQLPQDGLDYSEVTYDMSILDGSTPKKPSHEVVIPITLKEEKRDEAVDVSVTSSAQSSQSDESSHHPQSSSSEFENRFLSLGKSSRGTTRSGSVSPEDSFEREERILDKSAAELNLEKSTYTPSKLSHSPADFSPGKKLVYKKSSSILTAFPQITKDTTVGDITQETVYSQGFSSDDMSSAVINTNKPKQL